MELRPGYKKTDIGVIPDDWDAVSLGSVGQSLIGLTYAPTDVRRSGTLVLRSSNIQNNALAFEDNVFVEKLIPEKIMVRPGDVLVCVRNGSRELIGKAVLLDARTNGMAFGAFMAVFRSKIGALVNYHFQSDILKRQINEHLGATINQITNKSLNSFKIPVPVEASERKAIAEALSDADAAIEALSRLIAKKRDLRQGAMQRLLTGQTRLPGFNAPWQEKRLGALGRFIKGSGVRRDEAQSGDLPCVRYGEIYTTHQNVVRHFASYVSRAVAQTATRIQHGDLLFAASGETKEEIGKCVALAHDVEAYAGGDIIILRPTGGNPVFLGYLLNTPQVVRQKANKGQGDAVVHISAVALGAIRISLPDEREQDTIVSVLSDMDSEIVALEARLDKTRALKLAMMQALLTGRVRLPISRDVAPQVKEAAHVCTPAQ